MVSPRPIAIPFTVLWPKWPKSFVTRSLACLTESVFSMCSAGWPRARLSSAYGPTPNGAGGFGFHLIKGRGHLAVLKARLPDELTTTAIPCVGIDQAMAAEEIWGEPRRSDPVGGGTPCEGGKDEEEAENEARFDGYFRVRQKGGGGHATDLFSELASELESHDYFLRVSIAVG